MSEQGTIGCSDLKAQASIPRQDTEPVLIRNDAGDVLFPVRPAGEGERVVYAETFEL